MAIITHFKKNTLRILLIKDQQQWNDLCFVASSASWLRETFKTHKDQEGFQLNKTSDIVMKSEILRERNMFCICNESLTAVIGA
eukprot:101146-Amphidinium_carterae.1